MKYLMMVVAWLFMLSVPVFAETLTWNANTEVDLAGYKVYRSTISGQYGAPLATLGKVTTYSLVLPQLQVDTTYFLTVTAYDAAGNESPKAVEVSKIILAPITKPSTPILAVSLPTTTSLTVAFASGSDGVGGIPKVDIRYAVAPALTNFGWGSAQITTCTSSPCVIPGLLSGTKYEIQAVFYRDEVPKVFSSLSAVVFGTTEVVDVPPAQPQGLMISAASPLEVVIVASVADCFVVSTCALDQAELQTKCTITCVR